MIRDGATTALIETGNKILLDRALPPPHCNLQLLQPMSHRFLDESHLPSANCPSEPQPWRTFAEMLLQLHQEKIYIHPNQLAEFLLQHGLPVDLCYVPTHLRQKAQMINDRYQGDMARLEASNQPQMFLFE
jgi:hypothetical protein